MVYCQICCCRSGEKGGLIEETGGGGGGVARSARSIRRRSVLLSPDFVVDAVVTSYYLHARSNDVVVLFRRGSHAKQYLPTNLHLHSSET